MKAKEGCGKAKGKYQKAKGKRSALDIFIIMILFPNGSFAF
jgi:hypothetical protein